MLDSHAKDAQRRYLDRFTPEEQEWGFRKPWSCDDAGGYFADVGALLTFLPLPPGRLLDLGCGMGWTSCFFARRGYEVVGVDLAENMIAMANRKKDEERITNVRFEAFDFEADPERFGTFDAVVFYDSLHHSDDERRALAAAFRALRPGGVLVANEPGVGHAASAAMLEEIRRTGVTERDMEPPRIIAAARDVGFSSWRVYPRARFLFDVFYGRSASGSIIHRLRHALRLAAKFARYVLRDHQRDGLVVLTK